MEVNCTDQVSPYSSIRSRTAAVYFSREECHTKFWTAVANNEFGVFEAEDVSEDPRGVVDALADGKEKKGPLARSLATPEHQTFSRLDWTGFDRIPRSGA